MSKTREQKIKDLADEMARRGAPGTVIFHSTETLSELAEELLDAAERERPSWPTDKSLEFVRRHFSHGMRALDEFDVLAVRNAMLVDPIIKAAIQFVRACHSPAVDLFSSNTQNLVDAVKEAGLFDSPECDHDWKIDGSTLLMSNPPRKIVRCARCGANKTVRVGEEP